MKFLRYFLLSLLVIFLVPEKQALGDYNGGYLSAHGFDKVSQKVGVRVEDSTNQGTKGAGAGTGTKIAPPVPLEKIKVSSNGIKNIEKHLARMDADQGNKVMIDRLKQIRQGTLKPTSQDLNFYAHELREFALMEKHGVNYVQAHAQALKEYNIPYVRGYESNLYTQKAIDAGEQGLRDEIAKIK